MTIMLEMLCIGIVKFLLHIILIATILVVAVAVAVVAVVAVVEDSVVVDSVVLAALAALAVAVAVVVVDAAVVAVDSAWTDSALFNSYFLIETLLKEKRFYMIFIVVTLFYKYDKSHFFFSFDIRKNRIHKIVMMKVFDAINSEGGVQ